MISERTTVSEEKIHCCSGKPKKLRTALNRPKSGLYIQSQIMLLAMSGTVDGT